MAVATLRDRGWLKSCRCRLVRCLCYFFFFQAEDGIRDLIVTGVQTCALPISPDFTVQDTHGLTSTSEWTGVKLSTLLEAVGVQRGASWMLAEGSDAAGMDRSVPLTHEVLEEAMICYGQNGEALRPEQGFPLRLLIPGYEGNINIKWLRRLKFGTAPFMT